MVAHGLAPGTYRVTTTMTVHADGSILSRPPAFERIEDEPAAVDETPAYITIPLSDVTTNYGGS